MPKKTILRLYSIKKVLNGFMQRLIGQTPKEYLIGKYYRSIEELPLSVFIEVISKDDINLIVYQGNVDPEVIRSTWDTILEQYLDATFSDEDRHLITLIASANLLDFNITKAKAIIKYLFYRFDRDMINILIKMGATDGPYPYQGTDAAKEAFMKRVTAKVKKWQHTLKEVVAEIERIQPPRDEKKVSVSYFEDMLTKLSLHFHYHIDEKTITVSRYLSMYKEFKQHLLSLQKQAKTA